MAPMADPVDHAPRCEMHPRSAASWYCTICKAPKCEDCVQSTGIHGGSNAACRICGGRCIKLPGSAKAREDAFRGGGIVDPRDAEAVYRRDHLVAPLMLNGLCWVQFILGLLRHDPVTAFSSLLIWLGVGTGVMLIAVWTINHFLETYFGPLWQQVLKFGAMVLTIHVLQVMLLSGISIALSGTFDDQALIAVMSSIFPLALAMLVVPTGVLYIGLEYFFDLDPVELAAAVIGLYLTYTTMFFVLALNGVPI